MVFQPTWSMCRWVQSTTSTSSRRRPVAWNRSRKPVARPFQCAKSSPDLSSPTQVSTTITQLGVRTTSACTCINRRPSPSTWPGPSQLMAFSSAKVDFGNMPCTGATRCCSNTWVIVTSPTRHPFMTASVLPKLGPAGERPQAVEKPSVQRHRLALETLSAPGVQPVHHVLRRVEPQHLLPRHAGVDPAQHPPAHPVRHRDHPVAGVDGG